MSELGINVGLFATLTAITVAGLAAVLGIWMERDAAKPPRYAWALSTLILLTTFVTLMQSYLDELDKDRLKDDMARLLSTMDRIAGEGNHPELTALVQTEMSAQSRSNPDVVEKLVQRVADDGRDPDELLVRNLGAAEAEKVTRTGVVKPKQRPTPPDAAPAAPAAAPAAAPERARRGSTVDGDVPGEPPTPAAAPDAPAEPGRARAAAGVVLPAPDGAPVPAAAPAPTPAAAPAVAPAGRGGRSAPKGAAKKPGGDARGGRSK